MTRDQCATFLSALRRDDVLLIGKHRFRVENTRGVTVYITKGKGTKLYTLHVIRFDPCTIEVREVWGGSGELKTDVAALVTIEATTIRRVT